MTTRLVNKHLRHRDCDETYDTRISYHYVNDSLIESRRKRPVPKKLPLSRTIRCVARYTKNTLNAMVTAARNKTEPSDPLKLHEISITYSKQTYADSLISPITKEDFDFLCDSNRFTVTIEYSVNDKRMPPMSYTIYGHSQHCITKSGYIDRSTVGVMWMGLSPEHKGMGDQHVIDYDRNGVIDRTDKYLAPLAPIAIKCSTAESTALKNRATDITSKNPSNELYFIENMNHYNIFGNGKGMIHSITIVATQDPSVPNYTAELHLNRDPRYFTDPWSLL